MILICGIPNAGKTSFSKRYKNVLHYDDISHLSHDERMKHIAKHEVVEGIYNSMSSRKRILEMSTTKPNVCICIETPVDVCLERERCGRARGDRIVMYHASRFQPPSLSEGWDEIIFIRGDLCTSHQTAQLNC